MNTNNTIPYPQIQAIEPTENMKNQQQKHTNYQVGGFVLIVFGIGIGSFGAVNHLSIGFTVTAIAFFLSGVMCHNLSAQFKLCVNKSKEVKHSTLPYYADRSYGAACIYNR